MGDHLKVVLDEGYLSEKDLIPFREQQEITLVSLNGYIANLKRRSVQSKK